MKQRRMIIVIAALAIGIASYFLVFHNGYSGTFDLSCNGQEYSMELSELERTKVSDGVIYSAVFSDGGNNVKLKSINEQIRKNAQKDKTSAERWCIL